MRKGAHGCVRVRSLVAPPLDNGHGLHVVQTFRPLIYNAYILVGHYTASIFSRRTFVFIKCNLASRLNIVYVLLNL